MPKVFITRQIPEAGIKLLKDKGYEVEVRTEDSVIPKEELMSKIKDIDALLCLLTDKIDKEMLAAAGPNLKIIANYAVGYDNLDIPAIKEKGIIATNTPGVLTETVAEFTFALLLALAHRVTEADDYCEEGKFKGWGPMLLLGTDISKKTIGIVGLGRIGSRVAYHAKKGFDMDILYYDVKPSPEFEQEFRARFCPLEDLLKSADFVSIHVPLLPTTKHLIGEEQLRMMKKSAYLINTSRGPVVDEKALVKILEEGHLKGAALDVFEWEPEITPALKALPNVITAPHIASATEETRGKMSEMAAQNIIAALEGNTPLNPIV